MKLIQTVARILAYPKYLFKSNTCENCSVQKSTSSSQEALQSKEKPVPVILVPTKGTRAAIIRDWVTAMFFAIFAGFTIQDRIIKPKNIDKLEAINKSLEQNKDELKEIKKLINELKAKKDSKK